MLKKIKKTTHTSTNQKYFWDWDGHGRWTGWSRKVDGMVTESGWDGHGRWTGWSRKVDGKRSKTKDLL